MNIWFRRTNRLDGEGAVGLLDVRHAPTGGSSPRHPIGGSILGAPERQYSCDTLDLQRCRPFSAADTVVLSPVLCEPRLGPQESPPSGTGRVEQYDPRLDAWLPKLDRWPRLNGTGPGGPNGRPGGLGQSSPPSWPTNGLPAVPAQPGNDRRRVPAPDATLPGGTVGGLPFGGGLPCDGPLFGSDTTLAEMPWRAAAGEAHPMTAVSPGYQVRPGRPALDGVASDDDRSSAMAQLAAVSAASEAEAAETATPAVAAQTTVDHAAGEALPIFEQLRRESTSDGNPAPPDIDWTSLLAIPPVLETAWFAPEPAAAPDVAPTTGAPAATQPVTAPSAIATA